ncbi:MAG: FliM/FliN family flagellar motor switch protein [Planctomycetes bacterium]|nr:FliM/FliN family flagellar motor switch protein [Planctomycetota bacterium]
MTQTTSVEAGQADASAETQPQGPDAVEVREAALGEVRDSGDRSGTRKIDLLLDTTIEITATLGSVRMKIGDLLKMGTGAVMRLDRAAGEPVDLLLNGIPFATGNLVVVGDRLGVRLREVQAPEAGDLPAAAEPPPAAPAAP